jgi:uncharacterized membrane protein
MIFPIILFGFILRLISLNQSLWLDEATTALVAKMSIPDIFSKFLPADFHPPLYYLIIKIWTMVFGYSEISLRIPSIIFGLGTIYFIYLIGRKLFNEKTGLIASALLATSGLAVYYSQEARMYALATFLVSCSIYFLLKKKWIIFSVSVALIGMTDYVSLFIIPVYFFFGRKHWKKVILSLIPFTSAFLLWSPFFFKQILAGLSVRGTSWWNLLGTANFKNISLIPIKFMFGRISFDNKILYIVLVITALSFFGFLLYKSLKASKILWAWMMFPILAGFTVSFIIPTMTYFRYLFCLIPFYLLAAYGVEKTGKLRKTLTVVLIIFNVFTSGYYLLNPKFQREDWRGLVNLVESKKINNSITIFSADLNREAYLYYAPNAKITGREGIGSGYSQIWLVGYLGNVFDANDSAKLKIEALGYKEFAQYQFNGIGSVYLYESRNRH